MSGWRESLIVRGGVAFAFVFGMGLGLVAVNVIEQRFFPVNTDWRVAAVSVDGPDLVLSGEMRKVRACEYIAPVRGRTEDGTHLLVTSASQTSGQSWAPRVAPQRFGPWLIHGGAGQRVEIYQVHRCHPLWLSFSVLGVVDTRAP